ncbi:cell envelope integrity protein TolA [Caballeronia sp.]|uniref:cell envelope integrity protein TolA n=1 Tax=Caballeronia sp. TaxID=1931223 RepID=UPI003C31A699
MNRQPSGHPHARASARPVRPPRERGTWKAFALAALMHVLLGILLYHGVNWQNSTPAGAEAELWTDIPDVPAPRVVPPPAPPVKVQPAPPPAKDEEADIALQEKKRKQQEAAARDAQLAEQQRAQQLAQQEAEAKRQQLAAQQAAAVAAQKAVQEKQDKLDKQKLADKQKQLAQQKLDQQKADQAREKEAEAAKASQQQKEDADAKAKEQAKAQADAKAKAKAQADAQAKAKLDKERSARLAQLQGMAGGGTSSSGEGLAKSGTGTGSGGTAASAGYAEKVQRRVRPNIVWAGDTTGLETIVAVRCSPTGTLLSATISRSSGNDQWDAAALRAVNRSDPMPLDTNGEARANFTITLRPAGG